MGIRGPGPYRQGGGGAPGSPSGGEAGGGGALRFTPVPGRTCRPLHFPERWVHPQLRPMMQPPPPAGRTVMPPPGVPGIGWGAGAGDTVTTCDEALTAEEVVWLSHGFISPPR